MAEGRKLAQFPDVEGKLHAPSKKSLFEKQKAEAEAKRLREAEETAAVYQDFIKSFEDEDGGAASTHTGGFSDSAFSGGISGPPKRHFVPTNIPSGPAGGRGISGSFRTGAFNSGPGSLGPPPDVLSRKRTYEGLQPPRRENDRGLLAFNDYENTITSPAEAFRTSDDEDDQNHAGRAAERAIAKPTLRLSSLPPGTSPAAIKALLPSNLTVDAVRILAASGPNTNPQSTERKSLSAIVTLAKDTTGNDIEATVNSLQNRYLGFGFYLSLHRHLSSAAISNAASLPAVNLSAASSLPYGAKPVDLPSEGAQGRGAPGQRNFAPPTSYAPSAMSLPRNGPLLHVPVQPPQDIKELKLIHKTIESLLVHGPEFEALLMSRPNVQREEKWAWLWDPRSTGGVWYRWRLYEILTGMQSKRGQGKYLPLFEGSSAWKAPDAVLPFEYTTRIDEIVSDPDYVSSEEDDSGDERGRRNHGPPSTLDPKNEGKVYLNPLEKGKLTHLLARLPTSTGKLRKGDVARVTAFAISHAGRGADEVVAVIISNIQKPFAYSSANAERKKDKDTTAAGDEDATRSVTPGPGIGSISAAPETEENDDSPEKEDMSSAKLIGLYIISDILSSSSASGVRHAWRYRQLFEAALQNQKVFEHLGRLEKKMGWGRLRAEKWRRSITNLLSLWEGWCVFPQASHDHFVSVFKDPPKTKGEEEKEKVEEEAKRSLATAKNKWKSVEVTSSAVEEVEDGNNFKSATTTTTTTTVVKAKEAEEDIDGVAMDIDGEAMEEEYDDDENMDGEPMVEDGDEEETEQHQQERNPTPPKPRFKFPAQGERPLSLQERIAAASAAAHAKAQAEGRAGVIERPRPKAEDMFADSDEDEK